MTESIQVPDFDHIQDDYVAALAEGNRRVATDIAVGLLDRGVAATAIISDLIAYGQVCVGQGWQDGEWTVAMEHRASAVADLVLQTVSDTAMQIPGAPAEGERGKALVLCTEGEWHVLPGRMAAETLRLHGFDAQLIGPSVPASDLPLFLDSDRVGPVALTCSMQLSLVGAWRTISTLRGLGATIVIGGRGFGPEGRWGLALGADQWAPDFASGADLIAAATQEPTPDPRDPISDPVTSTEIFESSRERERILERAGSESLDRWPVLTTDSARYQATINDLSATLKAIQCAVLVGDDDILSNYVEWFEAVLRARDLPVAFVASAFDLLGPVLPDSVPLMRAATSRALAMCSAEPVVDL